MESSRFDDLARRLSAAPTRRDAIRGALAAAIAGMAGRTVADDAEARRHRKRKKRCTEELMCGSDCCADGRFCCSPDADLCCTDGTQCCEKASGTVCCGGGETCSHPWGDDVDYVCCPPERQWHTATSVIRCCPPGTVALEGITAEDGPCCPVEKSCGTTCCPDLSPVCADPGTGTCCTQEGLCGNSCCIGGTCCGGQCCNGNACQDCVGGSCQERCTGSSFCNGHGQCVDCGPYGCGG